MQLDNVMLELNPAPAYSAESFTTIQQNALKAAKKFTKSNQQHILNTSLAHLTAAVEKTREARRMGCAPDLNCWTEERNITPNVETCGAMRFAGGHVHISFDGADTLSVEENFMWGRTLDVSLGLFLSSIYQPQRFN